MITRKTLLACILILAGFLSKAQVATLYSFSQFQGNYVPVTTGGTVFNTSAFDDQDIVDPLGTGIIPNLANPPAVVGPGVDIGFPFLYNNLIFDRMAISNNGYIVLGNSADGNNAIYESSSDWNAPISATSLHAPKNQHRIAALGTDLLGRSNSNIRVRTLGAAPTRSCVIQWSNYQIFYALPTGADSINFQLWLYETSNIIDFVYGKVYSPTLDSVAQVGLRGGINTDFNNRLVTPQTGWAVSAPGVSNVSTARYNTNLFPAPGQTYRWSLPQCSGTLATLNTTANVATICPGSNTLNVNLQNTYTVAGISYTWSSSTNSSSGPFSPMPNGNTAAQNSISIGASTWFMAEATCIHSGITTSSTPIYVTVGQTPTLTASASPTSLCSGSSLTLNAVGNYTGHAWVGGYTSGVGFPASVTNTFTVIGTNAAGCSQSATVAVTVTQTPTQPINIAPAAICAGDNATLTAPGANSYTWTGPTQTANTATFVFNAANSGTVTYTVTRANGACVDSRTLNVVTNPLPLIFAIATPPTICALQPTTLNIGGGISYTWTAPGTPNFTFTGASPIMYPPSSSDYSVSASDGTCIAKTTVSVTVNPNPTITVSSTTPSLCIGQSVTLTAQGGINYTWTPSNTTNTLFTQTITDSPTMAVQYNVAGDNTDGCIASTSQIVLVYPNPVITVTVSKPTVCSGAPSIVGASGAHTYTWDPNAGGTLNYSTTVNPVSQSSGIMIYTVSGSYTNTGCQSSKTVQVSIYVPTLSVSGNTITCVGGQIALNAGGGNPNTYTWSTGSLNSNFPSLSTTLAAPAVFTISAMSTSLSVICLATKTVAVNNHSVPVITATAERSVICPKESTQLFAGGGVSYSWSNSQSGATITIAPQAQTNNYTVTGTDQNNCVSTGSVQVKLQNCNSINEYGLSYASLMVYPNPNNGQFTVQSDEDLDLVILNELGQTVSTLKLSGEENDHKVNVTGLAEGIYFINGQKGNMQVRQKLVVSK